MYFNRTIIKELESLNINYNKPILVLGARQIGKTTTIHNFLKSSSTNYIYVNFQSHESIKDIFEQDLDISRIELELGLELNNTKFDTIFFDEIQECPKALTSLKYFAENSSTKVICTGSGLGLSLNHQGHSFPVGKVNMIKMYQMSFIEFLGALKEEELLKIIKEVNFKEPINNTAHKLLIEKFDLFMMVSGFPESIESYIKDKDIQNCFKIISNIKDGYINDINKYASKTDVSKILSIYDNINFMLEADTQKFKFSHVDKQGYKSLILPFTWLKNSYLTYPVFKLSSRNISMPLKMHKKENAFKILVNDTSIIMDKYDYKYLNLMKGNDNIFKGVIYENYVGSVLARFYDELYYYHHKTTQVDYIINLNNNIVPIEVKSGKDNPSKSLKYFIDNNKLNMGIKVTRNNIYNKDKVLNIPVYLLDMYIECNK